MATEQGAIAGSGPSNSSTTAGMLETKGRELGRKADEVGDRVATGLREKAHDVDVTRQHLQERVGDAKDKVVSGVRGGRARVAQELQDNPTRTLVLAAGIGALTALLVARRMRK